MVPKNEKNQPADCDYRVGNHWSITIISHKSHKYKCTEMKSDQSSRGYADDSLTLVPAGNKSSSFEPRSRS